MSIRPTVTGFISAGVSASLPSSDSGKVENTPLSYSPKRHSIVLGTILEENGNEIRCRRHNARTILSGGYRQETPDTRRCPGLYIHAPTFLYICGCLGGPPRQAPVTLVLALYLGHRVPLLSSSRIVSCTMKWRTVNSFLKCSRLFQASEKTKTPKHQFK